AARRREARFRRRVRRIWIHRARPGGWFRRQAQGSNPVLGHHRPREQGFPLSSL
ncbi:hypothetical protein FRC01_005992, partial [Tulasnella sp. 417]